MEKSSLGVFTTKKVFSKTLELDLIIYDEEGVFDKYFWYFGIVGQNGSNLAVIIDTNGKVINS